MAPAQEHPRAGSRPQLPTDVVGGASPGNRRPGRLVATDPGLQKEAMWITPPIMRLWLRLSRWVDDLSTRDAPRSEEHTSELQSLMRISYAVFCLKKKKH